jgi:hypothetical protein
VVNGITDANGQFSAILTSGQTIGVAGVRAELLYDDGNGSRVVHTDRKLMYIGIMQTLLPLIRR